jgi:SAM-dependent methyltransferase
VPPVTQAFGKEQMISKSAYWYDALYCFKNYEQESSDIISLLKEEHPQASTVLDVACGTAEHDKYLASVYQVDGLDISEDFIHIASSKNPAGKYFCMDMTDFRLKRSYDVILCLFSSIGYAKTIDKTTQALCCFEKHLKPDGIIVIEPWFTPDTWTPDGRVYMLTGETPESKICRMNITGKEGALSILEFHYLVGTAIGVEHFTERNELGLFSVDDMNRAFAAAKLTVKYDESGLTGKGLYIARKKESELEHAVERQKQGAH